MTKSQQLENLIKKNNGIITAKLADSYNIHREYLSEFVKQGKLERVAYGVYITPNVWEDTMFINQLRKSKMIYSHDTALFLHDLTDRNPLDYCVTVPSGYNTSRLNQEGFKVRTIKKELFEVGICTKKTSFGNDVKTYDMERTICDILRDRNNQDHSVLTESLKKYIRIKNKDLNKLMKYAEVFKIEKIVRHYMEVLL